MANSTNTLSPSSLLPLLLNLVVAATWTTSNQVSGFTVNPPPTTTTSYHRRPTIASNGQGKQAIESLSSSFPFTLFARDHDKNDETQVVRSAQQQDPSQPQSRREVMSSLLMLSTSTAGSMMTSSFALLTPPQPALAASDDSSVSLLEQFGTDPSKITQKSSSDDASSRAAVVAKPKAESTIEPNLRSNYYYPTNKKRYLPRIKKCNDAIPDAAEAIGTGNWDAADEFVNKIADDTILPLKLYTSSLTGGGTNVKVSFTKDMFKAADDFEKAQKELVKAVKKRDQKASSKALEDLSSALSTYRVAGKLTGPDAGGDIPSVDEIRRSACRVQGRTFEQKVKARDARLAEAMAAAAKEENGAGGSGGN
jgi:hypothetical protein